MTSREHGDALRVRLHYHLSDDTIEGMYDRITSFLSHKIGFLSFPFLK